MINRQITEKQLQILKNIVSYKPDSYKNYFVKKPIKNWYIPDQDEYKDILELIELGLLSVSNNTFHITKKGIEVIHIIGK